MILQTAGVDIAQIIEKVYTAIEMILPYLIPFMAIVLPLVSGLGVFLKDLIEPLYLSVDLSAIDFANPNYMLYYIVGGVVLLISLVLCIAWPTRPNKEKKT